MSDVAAEATSGEVFDHEQQHECEGEETEHLDPARCRRW